METKSMKHLNTLTAAALATLALSACVLDRNARLIRTQYMGEG
jgi:hypothetical protein